MKYTILKLKAVIRLLFAKEYILISGDSMKVDFQFMSACSEAALKVYCPTVAEEISKKETNVLFSVSQN